MSRSQCPFEGFTSIPNRSLGFARSCILNESHASHTQMLSAAPLHPACHPLFIVNPACLHLIHAFFITGSPRE